MEMADTVDMETHTNTRQEHGMPVYRRIGSHGQLQTGHKSRKNILEPAQGRTQGHGPLKKT